jgi:hypothetical protein
VHLRGSLDEPIALFVRRFAPEEVWLPQSMIEFVLDLAYPEMARE